LTMFLLNCYFTTTPSWSSTSKRPIFGQLTHTLQTWM